MPRALTWPERAFVAVVLLVGVVLRVWVLRSEMGVLDSDEAVAGLMGLALLRDGDLAVFYWGQAYGGSLEPYLAVPGLAVFGAEPVVLKLTTVVLSAGCAVVAWRLARRWAAPFPAACVGLAMWVMPGPYVWWSTMFRAFYWVVLLCGLGVLLLGDVVASRPRTAGRARDLAPWAALGVVGGVGWWTSPQILFFAVPALVWIGWRRAMGGTQAAVAGAGAVLGALPWLAWNAAHGMASLRADNGFDRGVWGNDRLLVEEGLPRALGVRLTDATAERWGPWVLTALVAAIVVSAVRHRRAPHPVVLVGLASSLALWGWFPAHGFIGEARYVLMLVPFLVLAACTASGRLVAAAVVACCVASSIAYVSRWDDVADYLDGGRLPKDLGPLVAELERTPDACAVMNYWIAYRVAFASDRAVAVAPTTFTRSDADDAACLARARHRYVFPVGQGGPPDGALPEVVEVGGFVVYG